MTDRLHRSVSSSNGSSGNITQDVAGANVRVTAALTLRQSEELNQQILDSSDDCIKVLDLEGRIRFMSRGGQALLGIQDITPFLNTSWAQFWEGADRQAAIEAIAKARAGEVSTFQGYRPTLGGEPKWWDSKISPIRDAEGQVERLLCISRDITIRKRSEDKRNQVEERLRQAEEISRRAAKLDAFRVSLSDALRPLADPVEVQATASRLLGEYLGANRVAYFEVCGANYVVERDYVNGAEPLAGSYPIDSFGPKLLAAYRTGRAVSASNVEADPNLSPEQRSAYAAIQIGAYIGIPLVKGGEFVAGLAVHTSGSRAWTPDEVALAEEVAERTWAAVERARAEVALHESEEKYRTLFNSIDEGFCLVEVLFDDAGKAVDCRFLETNPAFETITTLKNAIGETARELVPNIEPHWAETLGKVAKTRQPERWINSSEAMGFWFDLYAFPVDGMEAHQVAIIFSNITQRKQAERQVEFLTELSRRLGTVTDAAEINRIVTGEVGTFLNGHRCYYLDVTPDGNNVTVLPDWRIDGPDLAGTYDLALFGVKEWWKTAARQPFGIDDVNTHPWTKDFADNYKLINLQSYAIAPFIREGRWVASVGVSSDKPRHWTADELLLLENVAARVAPLIERARAEAVAAADLRDTQLLRELGARLMTEDDIQTLYQEVISAAIVLTRADAGTVQILDEATQDLVLLATQGFERNMTEHFHRVSASSNTPCGIALRNNNRSLVDFDVPESEDTDGSMRMHVEAGYLSGQSTPLITRSGKPIGIVSTHWREHRRPSDRELRFLDLLARQAADLIEQRQTAAEREQLLAREQAARAEADRANRIKDEFLAVLSHELRSPLNPILGWSKLLQSRKLDAAKTQQALKTIERNAQLQSELIEDLLDVSRILQGKLNLNVSPINLTSIIRAAMETVQLAADAKSIKIEASLEPDADLISGDSTRLQQVIWNLLSNAVKFTPEGGQVNIRLERLGSHAHITVSDTGQGIAPDFLPYVFDYFRQANSTTTRKFGGLGLGLAIVRHLVELHGGTVEVESLGVGMGATFTVRLPLRSIQATADQNSQSSELSSNLNGLQVLVVDDEPDSREFVAFVLEQAGAKVVTATTAEEALTMLIRSKPDVLLSDIGMPDMDGYMLMQQVRMLLPQQGGQIPAIALTAYAGDFNQQQVLQAGFQQHVSKPVEPEVLVKAIANLLKSHSALVC